MPRAPRPIEDEAQAPLGEPPIGTNTATPLVTPRTPLDVYAVVALTPADVMARRPRWSENQARRWLKAHERDLGHRIFESAINLLDYALEHSGAPVRLARDRNRQHRPEYRVIDDANGDVVVEYFLSLPEATGDTAMVNGRLYRRGADRNFHARVNP